MSPNKTIPYVSRGGLKLAAALDAFNLDVTNFTCADLGANTGGFTDCLLQHGAAKVFAVDTGYGSLDWKLRNDPRVIVMERTNAMHVDPPEAPIDLVTIDLAWTRQLHAIPAALRWRPKHIITLIKPHYETDPNPADRGILTDDQAAQTFARILTELPALNVTVIAHTPSPIRGGAGKSKAGNLEYLALLQPALFQ